MREPIDRFPRRSPTLDDLKRALAECEAMLAKPRLSPEMRQALRDRTSQLREELAAAAARRARPKTAEPEERRPPRR